MRGIRSSLHDLSIVHRHHVNILGNSKGFQKYRKTKNILNWKLKIQANTVPAGEKDSIANRYMILKTNRKNLCDE